MGNHMISPKIEMVRLTTPNSFTVFNFEFLFLLLFFSSRNKIDLYKIWVRLTVIRIELTK